VAIKLYDLAGADDEVRFSPYCWRTRFALAHKGLEFETIPWRLTEKDRIAFAHSERVPVIVDGSTAVADSWAIAVYLEETYPDRPSLFGGETGKALSRFVNFWADHVLLPAIVPIILMDLFNSLHAKDRAYFRTTREARFGMTLEAVTANPEQKLAAFGRVLEPIRKTLEVQPYLGGATMCYADYAVFGGFQLARCVSPRKLVDANDPVHRWRERMLNAFGGMAAKAKGHPVL
jgi:glutathione S-transferase